MHGLTSHGLPVVPSAHSKVDSTHNVTLSAKDSSNREKLLDGLCSVFQEIFIMVNRFETVNIQLNLS